MITLSSDFRSPYPAAMKGVVLSKTDARLVDVAHEFPRQDVDTAAFWLREVLPTFPAAVHLVVVDPGVGTDRKALAIRAGDHALGGPANGVLVPAARALGHGTFEAYSIEGFDPASTTFHGRDVFAPAAAEVHEVGISHFGDEAHFEPVEDVVDLVFPEPTVEAGRAIGEVLTVDGFGNVITNVPGEVLADRYGDTVRVDDRTVPVARSYAHRDPGEALVTVGSHGNVELAVNQGRGTDAFDLDVGATMTIDWSG
jgi:S-adenosylmethionine hydrolase